MEPYLNSLRAASTVSAGEDGEEEERSSSSPSSPAKTVEAARRLYLNRRNVHVVFITKLFRILDTIFQNSSKSISRFVLVL